MPETTITFESIDQKNASIKRRFAQLKSIYKKGAVPTPEQQAEMNALMAEVKQLDADIDVYIENTNKKDDH